MIHWGRVHDMSNKKYNHYVPKFYLANFSGSNKCIDKCILSSQKIIRYASTKTTGGKDYLYGEDGSIEDSFTQLEGRWADIIRNIISAETVPSDPEDYEYLLHFIVLSENRTLFSANNNLDFWGLQYRIMAKMLQENGEVDIPDELIQTITAESDIPNLQLLREEGFFVNICADLQMTVIKNISTLPFITSDHPVARYNQLFISQKHYRSFGYGQMGIQLFVPISPTLCLVLFDPIPYRLHFFYKNKFIVKDSAVIRSINTLIAGYANQELYFSGNTSDRTIQKIIAQRRSDALSPATKSCRFGNGYLVSKSTPSYLHEVDLPLFSITKPFREMNLSAMFSHLRPRAKKLSEEFDDKIG